MKGKKIDSIKKREEKFIKNESKELLKIKKELGILLKWREEREMIRNYEVIDVKELF